MSADRSAGKGRKAYLFFFVSDELAQLFDCSPHQQLRLVVEYLQITQPCVAGLCVEGCLQRLQVWLLWLHLHQLLPGFLKKKRRKQTIEEIELKYC